MAIAIEGYTVVAIKERLQDALDSGQLAEPNATVVCDDDLWRCSFMAEQDADEFLESLGRLELNVSRGPDPDAVIVNEFDGSIEPYCEWLEMTRWKKAVIAWKLGSDPTSLVVREGFDPEVGSGLTFGDPSLREDLEFLRLDGNVEVYLDKNSGEELYVGRTAPPLDAIFKIASAVIVKHFRNPGESPVTHDDAEELANALEQMRQVAQGEPDQWQAHWLIGKAEAALGHWEQAYSAFETAYRLEKNNEVIPRELSGACLELGHFAQAVEVCEHATSLEPDNPQLVGNLAVAYLLAGRIPEAEKTIAAAIKFGPDDSVNQFLQRVISEVAAGTRPQPDKLTELAAKPAPVRKKFWQFWKKS